MRTGTKLLARAVSDRHHVPTRLTNAQHLIEVLSHIKKVDKDIQKHHTKGNFGKVERLEGLRKSLEFKAGLYAQLNKIEISG